MSQERYQRLVNLQVGDWVPEEDVAGVFPDDKIAVGRIVFTAVREDPRSNRVMKITPDAYKPPFNGYPWIWLEHTLERRPIAYEDVEQWEKVKIELPLNLNGGGV